MGFLFFAGQLLFHSLYELNIFFFALTSLKFILKCFLINFMVMHDILTQLFEFYFKVMVLRKRVYIF